MDANIIYYILLSILDSFFIIVLGLRVYRLPVFDYIKELSLIVIIAAVSSYLVRVHFKIPSYDVAIQFIIYTLGLRYLINYRVRESLIITSVGYLSFIAVQFIVYPILLWSGLVSVEDAQSLKELGTYFIQLSTNFISLILLIIFNQYKIGYTFIPAPPHDHYIKPKKRKIELLINIAVILAIIVLFKNLFWLINVNNHLSVIMPTIFGSLAILIFFSHRREQN